MTTFRASDGITLVADHAPGTRHVPVVLLHGGGQTRHAWGATLRALAQQGWPAYAVDQRGHGGSDWSPGGLYSLHQYARDVRDIVTAIGEPPIMVGASLGGIATLMALASEPRPRYAGIVLVDIAHRTDELGIQRIINFMSARREGFDDPTEAATAVAEYLPHREQRTDVSGLSANLRERDGRYFWHWDPAMVKGPSPLLNPDRHEEIEHDLLAVAAQLDVPTLLIRGGDSDVVTEQIADEFAAQNALIDTAVVEGARHMVAGDRNDQFTATILDYLERVEQ